MVHFIAAREGLKGLPREQLPIFKAVILRRGYMLLPIIIILAVLIAGYSAQLAAVVAIVATVLLSYIRKDTRDLLWQLLKPEASRLSAAQTCRPSLWTMAFCGPGSQLQPSEQSCEISEMRRGWPID